ncbi:nitrogen permease regulator 2-like protein [Chrysochromulina tobinii]|uniref:Nitrogen permease regulator 2-like protein n=1 Tax=Chrysochromulina tobinii TaxID=1460289 RepID=A0A0M0JSY1_9EUKA|nr:nitrogen permease regulator 2-like protein [Chrysochromulina tobinii]|eukprot:KOO29699.1 nitrogen permease regulator 2-like protein [Chrysochromulina sp. CCMP291]
MAHELSGLFFVVFDTAKGRTLALQEPPRAVLSSDDFDALADYLIPKPVLCGQLIAIREPDRIVLCWPMCIEDAKYDRNALLFSLGLVVQPPAATCIAGAPPAAGAAATYFDVCERYGPVLRKSCVVLAALERETQLLSDASRKGELAHLLPAVYHGLREHGRCVVAADAANTIHLQLPSRRPSELGPPVEAQSCPVLLSEPPPAEVRRWDLTMQRLLRWMDGTRRAVDIALAARVDLALVQQALTALQSSGWVRILDRFELSNCYACLPMLHRLASDPVAREALVATRHESDAARAGPELRRRPGDRG